MTPQNRKVTVQEVGLRDGLQSVPHVMPTSAKKRWIDAEYAAGVRHMEVASFVPARLLPKMADADEVIAHALTYPDLTVTALVPNLKGAEKALASGVHRIVAPVSVSAAHSTANVRKTPVEMVEDSAASGRCGTRQGDRSRSSPGCPRCSDAPIRERSPLKTCATSCCVCWMQAATSLRWPTQPGTPRRAKSALSWKP